VRAEVISEESALPRLHVVTDDVTLGRAGFEARAIDVLEAGGVDVALHLRGPATDGATLYAIARTLLPHARRSGALLFVNDRLDVALALEVDGAHLGHRSLGVRVARELLGDASWLGASVRDAREAEVAAREGADYVFLGTIFATPSHPGHAGMGLEGVAAVTGAVKRFATSAPLGAPLGIPVVAIGGIGAARARDVLGAGAHGIAAVRGVWDSRDPPAAVRRYRDAIAGALAAGRTWHANSTER
jgi:thiamine-phosphate pyrophosphorylase